MEPSTSQVSGAAPTDITMSQLPSPRTTSTSSKSPFEDFPNEILLVIAESLKEDSGGTGDVDLFNLALVAKRFTAVANDVLYRSPSIDCELGGKALVGALSVHQRLGGQITSLKIMEKTPPTGTQEERLQRYRLLLAKVPNLKEVTLDASMSSTLFRALFPSLILLEDLKPLADVIPFFTNTASNLEVLRLTEVDTAIVLTYLTLVPPSKYLHAFLLLKRIEIHGLSTLITTRNPQTIEILKSRLAECGVELHVTTFHSDSGTRAALAATLISVIGIRH